jgi:dihydroorotate dehydrogenase electron transfer subunit
MPFIFGCGPTAMLKALSGIASEFDVPCEVSLESPMACGVGLCQGCPVELAGDERKYALICKEGPVFNSKKVKLA